MGGTTWHVSSKLNTRWVRWYWINQSWICSVSLHTLREIENLVPEIFSLLWNQISTFLLCSTFSKHRNLHGGCHRKYVPILVYKQDELSERSVRRATWRCRFHCNCSSRFFFPDRHNTYTFTALSPRSAGWWFDACGFSNLNGIYYAVGHNIRKLNGIKWHHFRGPSYSLRSTAMMIRPYNFWAGLPQRRQAGGRPPRWPSTPRNIFTGFSYKRDEPEANICKSAS